MNKKFRQHYWDPLINNIEPVSKEQFIYTFNEQQESGTWKGWHLHECCGELVIVTSGTMVICTKTESIYVQANRAVWIPSGVEHEGYVLTKTENRSLFIHDSALYGRKKSEKPYVIEVTPLLRELIVSINDVKLELENEENKRLGLVLIDRFCLARKCEDVLPMPQNHKLVELCSQLLIAPDTPTSLSDWSEQLNISSKTLARIFVKETGLNFSAWQNRLRMECAQKYLEAGQSVTDAAFNCGYNSLSAFIAAFKKHYGSSPGVYKRSF